MEQMKAAITDALKDMPQDQASINGTIEHLGEQVGTRVAGAGVPREQAINSFREGLDRGYGSPVRNTVDNPQTGGGATAGNPVSERQHSSSQQ